MFEAALTAPVLAGSISSSIGSSAAGDFASLSPFSMKSFELVMGAIFQVLSAGAHRTPGAVTALDPQILLAGIQG
jgi:hypothetical protein